MTSGTTKTRHQIDNEIALEGALLTLGQSQRGICPRCLGGSSGESSFVISRDLGSVVRYCCFRATCGLRGRQLLGKSVHDNTVRPVKVRREMPYPVEVLKPHDVEMFRSIFDINPGNDIYWCPEKSMYAHKVMGPLSEHRGWMLRDYSHSKKPKAMAYPTAVDDGPFIGWFYPYTDTVKGVVIVEDALSAKKVADSGFTSVCLFGTFIDFERAYEIKEYSGGGQVYLALDKGTMPLMFKYRDKFEMIWGPTIVWQLEKDLKFVTRKRIKKAVLNGATNFVGDDNREAQL